MEQELRRPIPKKDAPIRSTNNGAKQLAALRNSAKQLGRLRRELEARQTQRTAVLNALLDTVERNPSHWKFEIVHGKRTVIEGSLSKPAVEILRAIVASRNQIPPGEGPGCGEHTGCTLIGEFLGRCLYLCKTVGGVG